MRHLRNRGPLNMPHGTLKAFLFIFFSKIYTFFCGDYRVGVTYLLHQRQTYTVIGKIEKKMLFFKF